jgi:hypothetical protein
LDASLDPVRGQEQVHRPVQSSVWGRKGGRWALCPAFWFGVLLAEGLRRAESHTLDGWLVNDLDPNLQVRR